MPDHRPPPTVSDLLLIAWQRRRLAGAVALALATPALAYVLTRAPAYEASARLVVGETQSAASFQRDRESAREFALVNTYRELLTSPHLLRHAAGAAGLASELGSDPGETLARQLRVVVNRDSWVLTVIMRNADPERAERLLGAVIEAFFARLRQNRSSVAGEDVRFMQEQLVEARRRLGEADTRCQRFRQETGIISGDVRDNHSYQRLVELQKLRVEHDRRLGETRSIAEQVQAALRREAAQRTAHLLQIPAITGDKAVADQQESLRALREREAQLGEKYLDKHPRLLEVRAQIKDREEALAAAAAQVAERMQAEYARLQRESADLDTRLVEAETAARVYRDNLNRL
ncbi:MAG: Wzz/FepE/Etk N-terminal domain-containing protein, partial [Planctomycetes bacterium]|nr:Wzz/FepE/Etk N-terminal domain-containing protein [Planctomycetota bacterium]